MAVDVPLEPDVDMRRLVADHEEIVRRVEKVNEEVRRGIWLHVFYLAARG